MIRNMQEAAVLAALRDAGTAHGYALQQEASTRLGKEIRPGMVYKALKQFQVAGLATARLESEADAATHAGPPRRLFTITGAGERALDHWLADRQAEIDAVHGSPPGRRSRLAAGRGT